VGRIDEKRPLPASAKIALLLACFFWAVSFIATKVALESTPPLTVVTLRLLAASVCFLAWYAVAGRRRSTDGHTVAGSDTPSPAEGREGPVAANGVVRASRPIRSNAMWWLNLLLLSLVGMGHLGVQTVGLEYTTAANAALYVVTAPVAIALLARVFLGEGIGVCKAVGIAIALAGVLAVMGVDDILSFELRSHLAGDLLVLASIVMWGFFTVFGKKTSAQMGALRMTALVTLLGCLWMIPICLVELHGQSFSLDQISGKAWLAILFLGVTCSFLATLLYFMAVERSESQKVGVYLYTIPPMTAVISCFYLGESLELNFFVGSVLVLCGVFLTERG
jgi:drug/metabolite transporter (DMT)-like permease